MNKKPLYNHPSHSGWRAHSEYVLLQQQRVAFIIDSSILTTLCIIIALIGYYVAAPIMQYVALAIL